MTKFLLAVLVAYAGWWLWRGPGRRRVTRQRPSEDLAATEARAVLGVPANASEADIRAAHHRLVSAVHPDRGGSAELTRRINIARDALLRERPSDS